MISLFIDTTTDTLVLGLLKDNKLLQRIDKTIVNQHSIYTLPLLEEILSTNHIEPKEIDKIFVVNGPGSWTGVRIGVTIAKVWASSMNKKVIPVSSLKAINLSNENNICMTIIRANKNTYYVGIYENNNTIIEEYMDIIKLEEYLMKYDNISTFSKEEIDIENLVVNKINLNIEKIIDYYDNHDSINPHELNANYLKKVNVQEKSNV